MDLAFCRMMAGYNAEMNRRFYAAAARLPEARRREDRGLFWRSLHGTLAHLLWADRQWMARFAAWPKPNRALAESDREVEDWAELQAARTVADAEIERWAAGLDADWLAGELVWFSGAAKREMRKPRAMLLVHMFNHQTHHRGQAHAALTAMGEDTGDTDLMLVA
jgi:uncharacterized damage-inducible protein DinB